MSTFNFTTSSTLKYLFMLMFLKTSYIIYLTFVDKPLPWGQLLSSLCFSQCSVHTLDFSFLLCMSTIRLFGVSCNRQQAGWVLELHLRDTGYWIFSGPCGLKKRRSNSQLHFQQLLFFKINFIKSMCDLQYCISFCYTIKVNQLCLQMSHSLLDFLPI